MKVTQYDHFKATPKSGLIGFFVLIVPVTLLTYFANEHHVSALVLISCITYSTLQQYLNKSGYSTYLNKSGYSTYLNKSGDNT